jgi:hypothetical protein
MTDLDFVLSSRDASEAFKSFLQVSAPSDVSTLQTWHTLKGYIKEYNRYRLLYESQLDNFIRWNSKCAKALIEKLNFSEFAQVCALQEAYRQSRKFPTLVTAETLKNEFVRISNKAKNVLSNKYFNKFGGAERFKLTRFGDQFLNETPQNTDFCSSDTDIISSDNYSSLTDSTTVDWRDQKKYKKRQKVIIHAIKILVMRWKILTIENA